MSKNKSNKPEAFNDLNDRGDALLAVPEETTVDERPVFADSGPAIHETAAQRLAADLRKQRPFEEGTIIAWNSHNSYNGTSYSYAAVFAAGRWYTTAYRDNGYCNPMMEHDDLMAYFATNARTITNLRVATSFEEVVL